MVEETQPLAKPATLDTNRVVVLPFKTIGTSGETADLGYGLVSTLTSKLQPLQNPVSYTHLTLPTIYSV